jgi:hypothetical protein
LLDGFKKFILQYWEGAIVVLVLLETLRHPGYWLGYIRGSDFSPINMLYLPTLAKRESLEIFTVLGKLADLLPRLNFMDDLRKYQWFCPEYLSHHWVKDKPRGQPRPLLSYDRDESSGLVRDWNRLIEKLEQREDMQILSQLLAQSLYIILCTDPWWLCSEKLTQLYLQARACDIFLYGKRGADLSFPQPTLQGVSSSQVEQMVDFMVKLLEGDERQKKNQRRQARYAKHEQKVLYELEHDQELHNKFLSVPITSLAPRLLSRNEIDLTLQACRDQFLHYDREKSGNLVQGTLKAIEDFVQFCTLLGKPDNHIKVPSGQYIEREVITRSFLDMEAEMAWELTNLPKHTAYVRLTQERVGTHIVVKGKMMTYELPRVPAGQDTAQIERRILNQTSSLYCKERKDVEQEISQRQKKLLSTSQDTSPSTHIEGKERSAKPAKSSDKGNRGDSNLQETDEVPPTSSSPKL